MCTLADSRDITLAPTDILDVKGRTVKVISDVHLGETTPEDLDTLVKLLAKYAETQTIHLVILGDFLDLLCRDDSYFDPPVYAGILASVKTIADEGRLSFVVGNHDLRLRDRIWDPIKPSSAKVWDIEKSLAYWKMLEGTTFHDRLGLTKRNTFHRYMCIQTQGTNWLFCHGDEENYGQDCKNLAPFLFVDDWRDLHYFLWRAIDSMDGKFTNRVWREWVRGGLVKAALAVVLQNPLLRDQVRQFALAPLGVAQPAFTEEQKTEATHAFLQAIVDLPGKPATKEHFFAMTTAGLAGPQDPEDAETLKALMSRLDLPDVPPPASHDLVHGTGRPFALADTALAAPPGPPDPPKDGDLDLFRRRFTPFSGWDRPTGDTETLRIDALVVGHRHALAYMQLDESAAGVPLTIDAGAWVLDVADPSLRATALTIKGTKWEARRGSDEAISPA